MAERMAAVVGDQDHARDHPSVIVNADHVRVNADLDPRTVAIREEMDAQADTNMDHENN